MPLPAAAARRPRRARAVRARPSRRRRLRQRRHGGHLDRGRAPRSPTASSPTATPAGSTTPRATRWARCAQAEQRAAAGRRRRERRPVPRLPRRPAGADPRPAPRHQPGDPAGAAAAGADQLAGALVRPDRRQPPRPHDRRARPRCARSTPTPATLRLPGAARRRGPGGMDGVRGVAGRQPAADHAVDVTDVLERKSPRCARTSARSATRGAEWEFVGAAAMPATAAGFDLPGRLRRGLPGRCTPAEVAQRVTAGGGRPPSGSARGGWTAAACAARSRRGSRPSSPR